MTTGDGMLVIVHMKMAHPFFAQEIPPIGRSIRNLLDHGLFRGSIMVHMGNFAPGYSRDQKNRGQNGQPSINSHEYSPFPEITMNLPNQEYPENPKRDEISKIYTDPGEFIFLINVN
jgi:hypothetical protein